MEICTAKGNYGCNCDNCSEGIKKIVESIITKTTHERFDERYKHLIEATTPELATEFLNFIDKEIEMAVAEERKRIVEIIEKATKLYGFEVIVTEKTQNEDEERGFENGREWTKERIINLITKEQ